MKGVKAGRSFVYDLSCNVGSEKIGNHAMALPVMLVMWSIFFFLFGFSDHCLFSLVCELVILIFPIL